MHKDHGNFKFGSEWFARNGFTAYNNRLAELILAEKGKLNDKLDEILDGDEFEEYKRDEYDIMKEKNTHNLASRKSEITEMTI